MSDDIWIRSIDGNDPALKTMLERSNLPTSDLLDTDRFFFVALHDGIACGFGGFELTGPDVLLRSIVVHTVNRGKGIGTAITKNLLERARNRGARNAYLLTATAERFFKNLGFVRIDKSLAPRAVADTKEVTSLCPASAVLMMKDLSKS